MSNSKSSARDKALLGGTVVAVLGLGVAAAVLFIQAFTSNARDPEYRDMEALSAYKEKQEALLAKAGWADDRALGGEAGQDKRAQALGFKRQPIDRAMVSVVQAFQKGTFQPTQLTEAQQKKLEKLEMGGVDPEAIVAASKDQEKLAKAEKVFQANCVSCHGAAANGMLAPNAPGAGPNLTDDYWLHGREPQNIYKTLMQGVAAKGMPPWGHLGEDNIKLLAAYVLSVAGTHAEGGKPPQGVDEQGNPPPADGSAKGG